MDEGVTKFTLVHQKHNLYFNIQTKKELVELNTWRHRMFVKDVIGCDISRYGACYGNVSIRTDQQIHAKRFRSFLISATQTGNLEHIGEQHYARVYHYDHRKNKVWSEGPKEPSSESMTHGAIYDLPLDIKVIFHIHSPQLWHDAVKLGIMISNPNIAYGTPEMAQEVHRLFQEENLTQKKIFSMGGHEDGIIAFGENTEQVAQLLLSYFSVK